MKTMTKIAANSLLAVLLLAGSGDVTPALAQSLACDDGIKTAFRPDADTSVVAVRLVKKGEELERPNKEGALARHIVGAADGDEESAVGLVYLYHLASPGPWLA